MLTLRFLQSSDEFTAHGWCGCPDTAFGVGGVFYADDDFLTVCHFAFLLDDRFEHIKNNCPTKSAW